MRVFSNLIMSLTDSFQALNKLIQTMERKVAEADIPSKKMTPEQRNQPQKATTDKVPAKPARTVTPVKTRKGPGRRERIHPEAGTTIIDTVQAVIDSNPGIDLKAIREKTAFGPRQVQSVVFRLKKMGKIKSEAKGVYFPLGSQGEPKEETQAEQELSQAQETVV